MSFSGRTTIPVLILAAGIYFLFKIHEVLLPFALAGVLAYLLSPLVRFFEIRGLRRQPVVIALYALLTSLLFLSSYKLAWVAALEAEEAVHNMPMYAQKGGEALTRLRDSLKDEKVHNTNQPFEVLLHRLLAHTPFLDYVSAHGKMWPQTILRSMPSFALGVFPVLEMLFLVPFIGFFFVREGWHWRDVVIGWVPSRYVEMLLSLLFEIDNSLGRYVRGLMLEALCVGALAYLGFWAIGLQYALQIAVIMGFANMVPYVGAIAGALLGTGVAIFQWGSLVGVVKVFFVAGSVRFIEDWFIQPAVLQRAVHLHPVLVVLALMSGAHLFGFWGLLFAVPVACMVKVLLEVLWPWYRSQFGFAPPPPLPEVNRIPLI